MRMVFCYSKFIRKQLGDSRNDLLYAIYKHRGTKKKKIIKQNT